MNMHAYAAFILHLPMTSSFPKLSKIDKQSQKQKNKKHSFIII